MHSATMQALGRTALPVGIVGHAASGSRCAVPAPAPRALHIHTAVGVTNRSSARSAQLSAIRPNRHVSCRAAASGEGAAPGGDQQVSLEEQMKKTQELDQLIDLLAAGNEGQRVKLVTENIMSFDQSFFLRIATRCDAAATDEDKDALMATASDVMTMVEKIVAETKNKMDSSATVLESVIVAAADPTTGEFIVPLDEDTVGRMRSVVEEKIALIDEPALSNAFAWMRKASEDEMDGMVVIIQRVLQLYAAQVLGDGLDEGRREAGVLKRVLQAPEEQWGPIITEELASGASGEGVVTELQKHTERVVLSLDNGSYTQRVLAEYLQEVEKLAKEIMSSTSEE